MSLWDSRRPSEIQLGNGTLLLTVDSVGEIEQIYSPSIDSGHSRLGSYRTSILTRSSSGDLQRVPVDEQHFEARLKLLHGSQILQVELRQRSGGLRLVRRIGVHPTEPLLMDSWQVIGGEAGILHESVPWIAHSTSGHCSLFHPTFNGVVHHRSRHWMGVFTSQPIHWVRVGHLSGDLRSRLWDGERTAAPISHDDLRGYLAGAKPTGWEQVVQGPATWGSFATASGDAANFFVICADSEKQLGELLASQSVDPDRFFRMVEEFSVRRHAPGARTLGRIRNARVRSLCERSIDVLLSLQDRNSGALMAAAEVDPHSVVSGGYGFSWPRDGAYLASALDSFGFSENAEKYFDFCAKTQDPSGTWWQRYMATGHPGPSWGRIQIDEPATVIGAAYSHYRETQNLFWLEKTWPMLERGLDFLLRFHSDPGGMGAPSHDLWEERMGFHAYSLAAVASAFNSGAALAEELSKPEKKAEYLAAGRRISGLIAERFFPKDGPVRRAFVASAAEVAQGHGYWDSTPDVSMLGLIRPFGIFKKRDLAANRILEDIRGRLWCQRVGGVLRYEGDVYRGGNPWILTTLWLGIVELSLGNVAEAKRCLDWVHSKATSQGMLAEQIHREHGHPCWVIPLGWSHAMYLLFVREALDRGLEKELDI